MSKTAQQPKGYLAQLERFGYMITAIGRTEKEARDAVIRSYREAYIHENGIDPGQDRMPYSERTYLALAKEELFCTEIEYGQAIWL